MKTAANILIVDDEADILLSLEFYLKKHFRKVVSIIDPQQLPETLAGRNYELILLDMNFRKGATKGKEGLYWLNQIIDQSPRTAVVVMTAYADVELAVEAVKRGAVDFVEKPWRNEKLLATLLSAYKLQQTRLAVDQLEAQQEVLSSVINKPYGELIGKSPAMARVFDLIDKVAQTDANILILGENGTGKELVARAIHQQSQRSKSIFVSVDLGAVPETLLESELFGHKKGAFTDARNNRIGQFVLANRGTLFLDEIGNLPYPSQAKLLSALQNRTVRPIGDDTPHSIDIRLICATNMPLYEMVESKEFRQDLLYRINTVELPIPPLRQRLEDLPLLADHFLQQYTRKYHKSGHKIPARTLRSLKQYHWPGNIRELRHAVERAVILSDQKQLEPADFFMHEATNLAPNAESSPGEQFESFHLPTLEKWAIEKAIAKHHGNITKAAAELGLTRAALYRRLEKHGL